LHFALCAVLELNLTSRTRPSSRPGPILSVIVKSQWLSICVSDIFQNHQNWLRFHIELIVPYWTHFWCIGRVNKSIHLLPSLYKLQNWASNLNISFENAIITTVLKKLPKQQIKKVKTIFVKKFNLEKCFKSDFWYFGGSPKGSSLNIFHLYLVFKKTFKTI